MWLYLLRLWMKPLRVAIQMKAIEQYFQVVLVFFWTILKNEKPDFSLSFELSPLGKGFEVTSAGTDIWRLGLKRILPFFITRVDLQHGFVSLSILM